jgi:serine/threonine protein kinase
LFECLEQSKNKRFSEKDAKFIFAQVVDIVDYLDRHGITHCDIKDENVVVDKDLRVSLHRLSTSTVKTEFDTPLNKQIKLIDFGSVVVADPSQPRPTYTKFFGTTAYASPEVALKQRYRAPAAEIWSLGILLSYLLTGMSPFITESDKMAGRIMLDSSANVSRTCLHLMTRCLQADPEQRADIAEVKAHPWLEGALV